MATIKPFKGLRPPQSLVEKVASRPYDVLNSDEARREAEGNDMSLYHIIRPEIDFPVGTDEHDERVYQKAAENFQLWQDRGWLVQDKEEHYYIYAQTMNGKTQYGLVVGAYVPDYLNGVIKKHELTRRDKEEDRMKHVRVCNANIEPVFFAYPDNDALNALIARYTAQKPVYDFIAPGDGFGHTFWVIDDKQDIAAITQEFAKMPALYIADGHHRSAAAARTMMECAPHNPHHTGEEDYNFFLAAAFPASQLKILPYNRAVKTLNGRSEAEFMRELEEKFTVRAMDGAFAPSAPGNFGMYLGGKWYSVTPKFDTSKLGVIEELDVSILQDNVLGPILGIDDPRTSTNIDFIGGIRGLGELEKLVNSGSHKVAFAMYPTTVEQLMNIADAGEIMPPKSTWFEPKLRDGLVCHNF